MPDDPHVYSAPDGREFALGWDAGKERLVQASPAFRRLYAATPTFEAPPGGYPKRFTLQKFRKFPHDQGPVGTCWVNAGVQVAQVMTAVAVATQGKSFDVVQLSRCYVGHYGCKLMGGGNPANGGTISAAMTAQSPPPNGHGNCHENLWPYKPERGYLGQNPPSGCDADAEKFHILQLANLPAEVEAWQGAIYAGHPIDIGLSWPSNFDNKGPFFDQAGWGVGGHSIIIYGWYERNNTLYWHCDNSHGGIYGVLESADFADFQGYDPSMHPEFSFFAADSIFRPRVARDGEMMIAAGVDGFTAPNIDWSQALQW